MTTKLLDTTFLIDYWGGDEGVASFLEATEETAEFVTSAINLKEVATGRRIQGDFDPARLGSTFEWLRVVPFTADHAVVASELEARLYESDEFTRREVDSLAGDVLIAAVAVDLDATVVTRNVADFDRLDVAAESY